MATSLSLMFINTTRCVCVSKDALMDFLSFIVLHVKECFPFTGVACVNMV